MDGAIDSSDTGIYSFEIKQFFTKVLRNFEEQASPAAMMSSSARASAAAQGPRTHTASPAGSWKDVH
jgi:hypothetical protein